METELYSGANPLSFPPNNKFSVMPGMPQNALLAERDTDKYRDT